MQIIKKILLHFGLSNVKFLQDQLRHPTVALVLWTTIKETHCITFSLWQILQHYTMKNVWKIYKFLSLLPDPTNTVKHTYLLKAMIKHSSHILVYRTPNICTLGGGGLCDILLSWCTIQIIQSTQSAVLLAHLYCYSH